MRTWLKLLAAASVGFCATTVSAADHGDGSAIDNSPEADITDVYGWLKADGTTLVLIQNIRGAAFADSVQYVFHVARASQKNAFFGPGINTDIICEFSGMGTTIQCWAGASAYVQGDASDPMGIANADNTLRVHAGQHADPFYFYLAGFTSTVATVNSAISAMFDFLPDTSGCPQALSQDIEMAGGGGPMCDAIGMMGDPGRTVGAVLRGMLTGDFADVDCSPPAAAPADAFAMADVSSIVIELDLQHLADPATGEFLQVWASTHQKP